jgi:hypothetical protein
MTKKAAKARLAIRPTTKIAPSMTPTPERVAKGPLGEARTYEFDPEAPGLSRRPARTVRDLNATAAQRLARLSALTPAQVLAGGLYERDHETARLEPHLTVNLAAVGGAGVRAEPGAAQLAARDRVHAALTALRCAGPDVVRVVEAVVLGGQTLTGVGEARYANRQTARVWATTALVAGLSLLEAHYREKGRIG